MKTTARFFILIILTTLTISACSSAPAPTTKRDPYNDADSQRSRAGQAQGEMSKDTAR